MLFFLISMIASFVFVGTWSVSNYFGAHKAFEAQRQLQPRGRPVLSRPVVTKR